MDNENNEDFSKLPEWTPEELKVIQEVAYVIWYLFGNSNENVSKYIQPVAIAFRFFKTRSAKKRAAMFKAIKDEIEKETETLLQKVLENKEKDG